MTSRRFHAPAAWLPQGWVEDVTLEVSPTGTLTAVHTGSALDDAQRLAGPIVPGIPNLHSHAFQRAMAGLAERAGPSEDSFWTWREVMYGFVGKLSPDQAEAIAAQLYVEMLKAGYTAVAEFHYLHHGPDGTPYDDLAEMALRMAAAAEAAGIGITLLPVLYGYGGFGGKTAGPGQRRFLNQPARYLKLLERLFAQTRDNPQQRVGIAPHSLRAVTEESLRAVLQGLARLDDTAPIHIHIAEQTKEVDDCLAWSGERPVAWLQKRFSVDQRWCLVHATHMTDAETLALATSQAVAGICPTTEANLGDGFFNALTYEKAAGRWGIGSDSHISVSPVEDLRWFEYGQRLLYQRRNLLSGGPAAPSVGAHLLRAALAGGAQACGRPLGALEVGKRADFLVLDAGLATLQGRSGDDLLDAWLFAGNSNAVRDVFVGGRQVVSQGRHAAEATIAQRFATVMKELT